MWLWFEGRRHRRRRTAVGGRATSGLGAGPIGVGFGEAVGPWQALWGPGGPPKDSLQGTQFPEVGRYNPTRWTQQGSAINGEEEGLCDVGIAKESPRPTKQPNHTQPPRLYVRKGVVGIGGGSVASKRPASP